MPYSHNMLSTSIGIPLYYALQSLQRILMLHMKVIVLQQGSDNRRKCTDIPFFMERIVKIHFYYRAYETAQQVCHSQINDDSFNSLGNSCTRNLRRNGEMQMTW